MGYYQFFVILICYLYLILLNAFTADAAGKYIRIIFVNTQGVTINF